MEDSYTEAKQKFQTLRQRLRSGLALRYPDSKLHLRVMENAIQDYFSKNTLLLQQIKNSQKASGVKLQKPDGVPPVQQAPIQARKGFIEKKGARAASSPGAKARSAKTPRRPARRPRAPKKQAPSP